MRDKQLAKIMEEVIEEVTGYEVDLYKLGWDGECKPILPGLLDSYYKVYEVDIDDQIRIRILERYIEEIEQLII